MGVRVGVAVGDEVEVGVAVSVGVAVGDGVQVGVGDGVTFDGPTPNSQGWGGGLPAWGGNGGKEISAAVVDTFPLAGVTLNVYPESVDNPLKQCG